MKELEIFLCRHGETKWSLSDQHTSFTDIPLTQRGKEEALVVGKRLERTKIDAVFSSPLLRARETCELAGFSRRMILEPDAVEWNYGAYEGLKSEEIGKKHPGWNLFEEGAPKGESPEDVAGRADRIIEKFLSLSGNVLLFSHGHFLRVFAARWIGLEPRDGKLFALGVASLSLLGFEREQRIIKIWNSQFSASSN